MITESDLPNLKWDDVAILQMPDNVYGLIFLCSDESASIALYDLLKNGVGITVFEVTNQDRLLLTITFPDSEYYLDFITGRTLTKYPPLQWLKEGKVSHFTTGYRIGDGRLQYKEDFLRLMLP